MLGIIHLLHCPCLIILPFLYKNPTFDFCYIEYFLGTLFSYTFIHGECPISYIYKKRKDPNYIAGSRIANYPEMNDIFIFSLLGEKVIPYYFGTTTILYLGTLIHVIHRSNIPFSLFIIPTNSLLIYFTFVYKYPDHPLFNVIQDVHKIILFFFMVCLMNKSLDFSNILNNFFVHF